MTDYMFTCSSAAGWRDIAVMNACGILEAIDLAQQVTGCLVSHGRGGIAAGFDPGTVIYADTGQVDQRHDRAAKPEVQMGPPEVMRDIAAAMKAAGVKA